MKCWVEINKQTRNFLKTKKRLRVEAAFGELKLLALQSIT
jgi:hypothetical protein